MEIVDPGFDAVHVATARPVAAIGGRYAFCAFAVVAEREAFAAAKVPEKPGGGGFHFFVAGKPAVSGVADHPAALFVVGGHGGVAPAMAVHADFAIAVKIVEEDVVASELVVVRTHSVAINGEARIAVAGGFAGGVFEIAEDLVVGAIFFDDVKNVFDRAARADVVRYDAVAFDGGGAKVVGRVRRVALDLSGVVAHLFGAGSIDKRNGALDGVTDVIEQNVTDAALGAQFPGIVRARVLAFAVADEKRFVVGTDNQCRGIPAGGNETVDGRRGGIADVHDGDVVVVGVGNEEGFAVGRKRERVGRAAFG